MRLLLTLVALYLLSSCGLETVPSLDPPNVDYNDQTMVTNTTLSVKYQTASGTDLQGYQVYYKIYPGKTNNFLRLVADRDSVNLSPTVSQLTNLGYYQMSQSSSSTVSTGTAVTSLTPLLLSAGDNTVITLDFTSFEAASPVEPQLEVGGVASGFLYRSSLLFSGNVNQSFTKLHTLGAGATGADISATGTEYEINVFVVAYGLSSTLQAVYSKPVPWGVIRSLP